MSDRPRVFLIDGYSNIFRAYYAIRHLSNSKGEATNAVFGFLQILRKLLRDEQPQYLGVALDVSGDTVRKERYAEYKANRKPMPEDLRPQIPWIRKVLEAYRIPQIEMPKYEADDVLGTLAKKATAEGYEVVLVSADKDLMQLVGNGVSMFHTGREKLYDADLVTEDFGVPPNRVIDVLALMGDASDNVPGVPGIGEKGAKKLINEYGSFDELLERAGEVKRKSYREGLQEHRDMALLSKELVTIHTDLPIRFDPKALLREEPKHEDLLEIFYELDFKSLADEIESEHGVPAAEVEAALPVLSTAEWKAATKGLRGKKGLRGEIHLSTVGGEQVGEAEVLGLAIQDAEGRTHYADFGGDEVRSAVLATLHDWIADPKVVLVGHDLKEVIRLLERRVRIECRLFDTMLGSYLLMSELRGHAFSDVALARMRRKPMTHQEAGWAKGSRPSAKDPMLLTYATEHVELPRRMAGEMREQLDAQGLTSVYETLEEPLVAVLTDMEEIGVKLDVPFLESMSKELAVELETHEEEIYKIAGERFNINSPRQLGELMFEKLGYPVLGRTRKTKSYSTGAETLEELAARGYDLPSHLLSYREVSKLKSTYVDALPPLVAEDGRLHTRFNQAVASTGRLSSAHPNLQNIPVRTEAGQKVRKAFCTDQGYRLVVADYSQIELRVLAHIAEEESMIEAFERGEDIHAATAAAVFDVSPMLVNSEQRRMAKTINFGIIYGISGWGLARQLGITKKEAEAFIKTYLARYAGVQRYTEETIESAQKTRRVETMYGRVRTLPDINSRNYTARENAKRMAINARIQGTAADLLKLAMIAVDRRLRRELPRARLLLTVHDELMVETPEADVDRVTGVMREEMTGVAELKVPLVVDAASGRDWYEAKA